MYNLHFACVRCVKILLIVLRERERERERKERIGGMKISIFR